MRCPGLLDGTETASQPLLRTQIRRGSFPLLGEWASMRFIVPQPELGACAWDTFGIASENGELAACSYEYEVDDVVVVNECTRQFG